MAKYPTNPAHDTVLIDPLTRFQRWTRSKPPLGIREQFDFQGCEIPLKAMLSYHILTVSPWIINRPVIIFDRHTRYKQFTPANVYKTVLFEIIDQYKDYSQYFTG